MKLDDDSTKPIGEYRPDGPSAAPAKPAKPKAKKAAKKAAAKPKAKPAKKSAKKAPAGKSKAKKAAKRKPAPKGKTKPAGKPKGGNRPLVRVSRLDLRCTPKERALVVAIAKRKGQTKTQVVMDAIRRLK